MSRALQTKFGGPPAAPRRPQTVRRGGRWFTIGGGGADQANTDTASTLAYPTNREGYTLKSRDTDEYIRAYGLRVDAAVVANLQPALSGNLTTVTGVVSPTGVLNVFTDETITGNAVVSGNVSVGASFLLPNLTGSFPTLLGMQAANVAVSAFGNTQVFSNTVGAAGNLVINVNTTVSTITLTQPGYYKLDAMVAVLFPIAGNAGNTTDLAAFAFTANTGSFLGPIAKQVRSGGNPATTNVTGIELGSVLANAQTGTVISIVGTTNNANNVQYLANTTPAIYAGLPATGMVAVRIAAP